MKDGIYRANLRADSDYIRARAESIVAELLRGGIRTERGKETLVTTRREVEQGWRNVGNILMRDGQADLAMQVKRFIGHMPVPRTDKELIAAEWLERIRGPRTRDEFVSR